MSNGIEKNKTRWKPPQWLLDASRKRSGVPMSQAVRDRLQYVRDHSEEHERKLREDSVRAGRDPDAFAKMLAGMRQNSPRVRLPQRPKETCEEAALEEVGNAVQSVEPIGNGKIEMQGITPSPNVDTPTSPVLLERLPTSEMRSATRSTERSVPPPPRKQRTVPANGQATKRKQGKDEEDIEERSKNKQCKRYSITHGH